MQFGPPDTNVSEAALEAYLTDFRRQLETAGVPLPEDEGLPLASRLARLHEAVLHEVVRKRCPETRAASQAAYAIQGVILDGTHIPVAALDTGFRYLLVNDAYRRECRRVWGVDVKIGASMQEALAEWPEDWRQARELWARALSGESFDVTASFGLDQASRQTYELHFYPVHDEAGRMIGAAQTSRNVTERVQMKQALRDSEERFQLVSRAINDIIWDWDILTDRLLWSEAVEPAVGRLRTDIPETVQGWIVHIHPDDRNRVADSIYRAVETGDTVWSAEYRFGPTGGPWRIYLDRGHISRDESGRPHRMIGSMIDLTERKQAEEAIRQSEARFRLLANAMPQLVWTADPDGRVDYYNRRYHEYAGIDPDGNGGFNWAPVLHPDDLEATVHVWQNAIRTGKAYQAEHRVQRQDGSYRWHISRGMPARDSEGRITKWFGTATDIHDMKTAQEELRRKEERLRLAQQVGCIGSFERDLHTGKHMSSSEIEALYGMESGEIDRDANAWLKRVHPEDRAIAENCAQQSLVKDNVAGEWRILLPDGTVRWIAARVRMLRNDAGEPSRIIGINMDITERKEAEERERLLMSMYRAHSEANEAILRLEDESALFPLICRIAVEHGGMMQAWVGIPDQEGRLLPAASYGKADPFVRRLVVMSTPGSAYGHGPGGIAFRENRPVIVNDVQNNELTRPWKDLAAEYGVNAVSTYPILRGGKPHAILVVYSNRTGAFHDEIVQLLIEMAANISFALDNFDRETARRHAEEALRQSELRFRVALDNSPVTVFEQDLDLRYTWIHNPRVGDVDSVIGKRDRDYMHYQSAVRLEAIKQSVLDSGKPVREEVSTGAPGGQLRHYDLHVEPRQDREGQIAGIICTAIDITDRKQAEEELRLAAAIYQDSSEAMLVTDERNLILAVNRAFCDMTGHEPDQVIGRTPRILQSGRQGTAFYLAMREQLGAAGRWKGELWNRKKNGDLFAVQLTINVIANAEGASRRYVGLMSDITEKKQSDELIWRQANFDTLTGLPNRRLFRDRLGQEISNARRSGLPLALMFLDLDGFKYVNDTLGHDTGDLLLKEAALRLRRCLRESDTVARLGGDEFTVILHDANDPGSIDRVANHILIALSEPIQLGEETAYVSASIGITLFPQDGTEIENLLKNADQAMYAAKQSGKNQYHYFTLSMQEAALTRMRLISDLRSAQASSQFEIVYQPIVELTSGSICKAEALIRWRHPTRGLVNPVDFISTAEDTGLIASFGNWMMQEATRQASAWREKHDRDFQISVNISPVQFRKGSACSSMCLGHLEKAGLRGQGLVLEITEGLLMDASEDVRNQLLLLRDAGVQVALDDFGTGYSSLSYLRKFDIDYIKIDQTFVRNLSDGSDDMVLCEAIIALSHKLGIRVIAEGVETAKQHELLANAGCDYGQGYLFSCPVTASEFDRLLEADPFAVQNELNI